MVIKSALAAHRHAVVRRAWRRAASSLVHVFRSHPPVKNVQVRQWLLLFDAAHTCERVIYMRHKFAGKKYRFVGSVAPALTPDG